MLFKQNSGFVYGGTISFNVWDEIHTVVERVHEENCDNWYYNPDNALSASGHIGYSWEHIMLLFNLGYESGIKGCLTVAFPLYFVE